MADSKSSQEDARQAAIRAALKELQAEYAQELPGLVADLVQATSTANASGSDGDLRHLQTLAHRMHGAAGSYGFRPVSAAAAKMEELLAARLEAHAPFDAPMRAALKAALSEVQATATSELEKLAAEQ